MLRATGVCFLVLGVLGFAYTLRHAGKLSSVDSDYGAWAGLACGIVLQTGVLLLAH